MSGIWEIAYTCSGCAAAVDAVLVPRNVALALEGLCINCHEQRRVARPAPPSVVTTVARDLCPTCGATVRWEIPRLPEKGELLSMPELSTIHCCAPTPIAAQPTPKGAVIEDRDELAWDDLTWADNATWTTDLEPQRGEIRLTICWSCHETLNSDWDTRCSKCEWIRCACGACRAPEYGGCTEFPSSMR
jgi:hypothetical protein